MEYLIICHDKSHRRVLDVLHHHLKTHREHIEKELEEKGLHGAIVEELNELKAELVAGDMKDAKECLQSIACYAIMAHCHMIEEE